MAKRRRKKNKARIIIPIVAVSVLVLVALVVLFLTNYSFRFTNDNGEVIQEGGAIEADLGSDEMPEITAVLHGRFAGADREAEVSIEGDVDLNTLGEYPVTLTAKCDDRSKSINVTVSVVDKTPPEITLIGGGNVKCQINKEFKEPGYAAKDKADGDVTDKVTVEGTVNTKKLGEYTLTYKVSDSNGNEAIVTRTVEVVKYKVATPSGDSKVVYLTFDDGPGPYTSKLLDILDEYKVKVTFFVTHLNPNYESLIKEEADRGHTIAIHSYSHDYKKIYASTDAYYKDLNAMKDVIVKYTGTTPKLVRFPGGSSNAVSPSGMMKTLSKDVESKGYTYVDWNVSTGDGGNQTTTEEVVSKAIAGMQQNDASCILMHDVKETTVNGVSRIIEWGLANGYTFMPLSEKSPKFQHILK